VYAIWCKTKNIKPDFVTLDSGCKGFWLGDKKDAKYVMVYFHGISKHYPISIMNAP